MIATAACLLYTQDDELVRRSRAFLLERALFRHVQEPDRLWAVLQQNNPAVLIMDLRAHESRDLLPMVQEEWPQMIIVAFGTPRSEPLREAELAGVYAAEDLGLDRHRFQTVIERALDHLRLQEENQSLRQESAAAAPRPLPREKLSEVGSVILR